MFPYFDMDYGDQADDDGFMARQYREVCTAGDIMCVRVCFLLFFVFFFWGGGEEAARLTAKFTQIGT